MARKKRGVAAEHDADLSVPMPIMEATAEGLFVRFDRMQVGAFVGGRYPTIEACQTCGNPGVRVSGGIIHTALLRLDFDNEPAIRRRRHCGNVNTNIRSIGAPRKVGAYA